MGRPREFDPDLALESAMRVFWRKGFEGTSLNDLTDAMGITRPSLYSAFGNKEQLFRKALARYEEAHLAFFAAALNAPDARSVAERILSGYVDALTAACGPGGCLGINAALACGAEGDPIRDAMIERRHEDERRLAERFARAKAEGDLSPGTDPDELARYVMSVYQGMAVQSAGGADRAALGAVVRMTVRGWPG